MKVFDAVIFDMDGLLIDTERLALVAYERVRERLGLQMSRETYNACVGTNFAMTERIVTEALRGQCSFETYYAAWRDEERSIRAEEGILLRPGVFEVLIYARALGLPLAVATSTRRASAERMLKEPGLFDYLDALVGGDEVTRSKPEPDIYLRAAELLKKDPAHCVAFEDSNNGARSAHAAGMTVVQIPDQVPTTEDVKALGVIILNSLTEVPALDFTPLKRRTA